MVREGLGDKILISIFVLVIELLLIFYVLFE